MLIEPIDYALVKSYYNISPEGVEAPVFELNGEALLDSAAADAMLGRYGELLRATSPLLPASFAGLAANHLVSTLLIVLAQHDAVLALTPDRLKLQIGVNGSYPRIGFMLLDPMPSAVPAGDRGAFVRDAFERLLRGTVVPFVQTVSAAAGVKPALIWNQAAGQTYFLRDAVRRREAREDVRARFEHDFAMLTNLPVELFGQRRNPYRHTPVYIDNPFQPGTQMMMRSACCMYDRREGGAKCYNCPGMTETARDAMRKAIAAKAQ